MTLRRGITGFLGALFICVGLATPIANAQQTGNGLQISPTRSEISASSGEQKQFTITIKNITQSNLTAKAILNDFESDEQSGTPKIQTDTNVRTPYSLQSMLRGLQDVQLKAGETKEVRLTLDVPGNAAPGAYFGAVRYSVTPEGTTDGDRQIALNASVAHLVFLEVPGDVTQQIRVESLKAKSGDKIGKFFFSKAPNEMALGVRNLGNGFSRPFGTVEVKNMFGKQVSRYDVNNRDPRGIVLPNSSRTFTDGISQPKLPGKYSSVASVAYGNGGEVVNYKSSFWYLPIWFLVVVLVLILVLVGGGYFLYRKKFSRKAVAKPKKAKR